MNEAPRKPRDGSKMAAALELLIEAQGRLVTLPEFMRLGLGATHSAMATLRSQGWHIQNRKENNGGEVHSSYRLTDPEQFRE